MKTDTKLKVEKNPPKLKMAKGGRRASGKPTPSNGKHPPTTYEHAPIGIVESSLEGKYINVNEEFCRMIGYEKEEIMGCSIKDFTHEDDYPIELKMYEQLVAGKIPFYRFEKRYVHKNGEHIWVELTRSLVRDTKGKPLYTIGVVLDISERKHVERVLRDSSERLRLATEAAQMFMWEWDFENQVYTLADNFTQVLGFSADLLSKNSVETIQRLMPAEDLQSATDAFKKAFANQKDLHSLSCRVINPENGQTVWLEISAKIVYDYAGKPARMFGVAQNITENKQREEALGESEERFRALVSQATAGIAQSDLNGRFTFVNPKLCEMLGYAESELIGKTIWELTYANDLEENKQLFERMVSQGESYQFEKRFIRRDGSLLWTNVSVSAIRDSRGKPKGGVGVVVDINERKRMETEIEFISKMPAENPNPIMRLTPGGQILYANKPGDSLLKFWKQQIHQTIPNELQTHVVEAFSSGLKKEIEIYQNDKTFSCTLVPIRESGYVNFYGNDITERKRAEKALQEKDKQLRHITNVTPVLLSQCSSDLRYLFVNKTAAEFLGSTPEEITGKPIWQIMGDEAFDAIRPYVDRVLQGQRVEFEMEIPYPAAGRRFMHVIYEPERDDKGVVVGWIATVTDITERKHMEGTLAEFARQQEALYQLADQLNRTNSLEDGFTAALEAILNVLQCDRASILLFDQQNVMRFVAWRGLSDAYRKATEGHSPWKVDEENPQPICMNDVRTAELSDALRAIIEEEGIGSLAFIPLVSNGKLIGKFMVYFNAPHIFSEGEIELSQTIAHQLAFDIDHERAEEKLRESEERYRVVVESQSEMLCRFRPDGTILFVNGAYARARGTTPEELINHSFWEFITEADRPAVKAMLDSLTPEAPEVHIENRFETAEGERWTLWTNRALRFDSNGRLLEAQSSGIDITDRIENENALRASEEENRRLNEELQARLNELNALLEILPTGVWIGNSDCSIITGNPAAYQILGLTPGTNVAITNSQSDVPTGLKIFVNGEEVSPENAPMQVVARSGKPWHNFEHELLFPDGTQKAMYGSVVPLLDQYGAVRKVIGTYTDFTERKQAEKRLVLLTEISELTRQIEDPQELMYAVAQAVGEHLQVKRCLFNETDIENDCEIVYRDYHNGVESAAGVHKISDYSRITSAQMEAGKTVVNTDSKIDARTAQDYERTYRLSRERAYVAVPLMRENRWVATFWVSDDTPRQWSQEDVTLIETVAERTWTVIEKLLINKALRASEELYRMIARSIPGGGVYVIDKNFRYMVAEGPVTEAFGLSREKLEGHTVMEVFPDERGRRMEERLRRNFAGESVDFETQFNRRSYWTQMAPLHDSIGQAIILTLDITERKQAEEALRQSEERFTRFMQHLPGLAWIKDTQGRYMYVNAAAEKAFNTPREKLYGKTDEEVFPPEVAIQFKENDERALTEGTGIQVVETLKQDDGILHYSLVSKFPIPGPDGTPALIGGTAFDITERLRAEQALRESEIRFREMIDSLPAAIYTTDAEGRLTHFNPSAVEFSGRVPEIGTDHWCVTWKLYYPDGTPMPHDQCPMAIALKEGRVVRGVEAIAERPDGTRIWFEPYPTPLHDSEGTLVGGINMLVDITERKQVEQALRESEERFSAILRQATAGIVRKNAEGRFVFVNQAFCNMLGYTEADLIGKTVWEFMHEEDVAENKRSFDRLMMEGVPFKLERRFLREDGSLIWVDASVSPIMDAEGKPQSAVAIEVDITGRKQAEEALQQLNIQLENRVETRTAELRAANQALQESRRRLQILSQRLVDVQEEERHALARELHDRVGQTLAALNINLIIISSQLSADVAQQIGTRLQDSMNLVAETIALVRNVMTDLRPAVLDDYGLEAALESHLQQFMSRYEIKAKLEKPEPSIPRLGPSLEMTFLRIAQEALMNIARHAHATDVKLSLRQEHDVITMTVQDNGVGIESLQEANRPGSHGLTIMRERAEAFGGTLQVRSAPGKGTNVEVSIPFKGHKEIQESRSL